LVNIEKQLGYTYAAPPAAEPKPMPMPPPPTDDVPTAALGDAPHDDNNINNNSDGEERQQPLQRDAEDTPTPQPYLRIDGLNRASFAGSFAVHVVATIRTGEGDDAKEEKLVVASDGVLSRWNVGGCANCQTHMAYRAYLPLPKALAMPLENDDDDDAGGDNNNSAVGKAGDEKEERLDRRTTRRDVAGHTVRYDVVVQDRQFPGDGDSGALPGPQRGRAPDDRSQPSMEIGYMAGRSL
jgi:hypothetical protein